MSEGADKFSIILFSGTVDKIMAATTLAAGAVAMGKETTIFLTFWGLMGFRKGDWQKNMKFSKDFEEYAQPAFELMQAKNVPHWMQTLQQVSEIGDLRVKACGLTMDLFGIKLEDLEPIVSEVTGVASFMQESEGGQVLFI
jgi:peroxiredoxin family protein